jgi:uncharacterized coiled-coil DUF342 family protein
MKQTILIFLLFGLLFTNSILSFGHECPVGDEKYEDAKLVLTDLAVLIEAFVENMNQVDQSKDVAKVLDTFAESMKSLVPKINEIREKYPELNNEDTHPEELKPLLQRIDKDFQEMMKAYAKVKEHMEDPAVQEADAKYKEVMSGLR